LNSYSSATDFPLEDILTDGVVPSTPGMQHLSLPLVSVVVPVKNEAETIETCLRGLLDLDYDRYEILIVDTGSTDNTREIVKDIEQSNQKIRLLTTSGNAPAGRNVGIREARGDILAFTDGDCIPTRTWLRTLVRSLVGEGRSTAGVGGPNVPTFKVETRWSAATSAALNTFFGSGGSAQVRNRNHLYVRALSTANSAFWTESVRKIGSFDFRLDLCEDADLCSRLAKTGSRFKFEKSAVVYHWRDYRDLWKFGRHMFKYGKWRGKAIGIKPRTNLSWTSIAILGALASMITLLAFSVLASKIAESVMIFSTTLYLLVVVAHAVFVSKGFRPILVAVIPTFLVLHASYSAGLITGILSTIFGIRKK
jgi:cellulose synthase/poly-beta-1,6-N-acetylglucosamine synthase-like glycosyltransferase